MNNTQDNIHLNIHTLVSRYIMGGGSDLWKLDLQTVVSCQVDARNQNPAL